MLKAMPYVMLHFSQPIGSFMSGVVECQSPCINVTAGQIVISTCINATLTVICYTVGAHLSSMAMSFLLPFIQLRIFSFLQCNVCRHM